MDKTQMTGVGIARCFQRPRRCGFWAMGPVWQRKANSSAAEAAPERKADPSTPLGMTGWVGRVYVGAEAPTHKAGGGVARCFQRPRRCLSPATIPPLRGQRSQNERKKKLAASVGMTGGGVAFMSELKLKLRPPKELMLPHGF